MFEFAVHEIVFYPLRKESFSFFLFYCTAWRMLNSSGGTIMTQLPTIFRAWTLPAQSNLT